MVEAVTSRSGFTLHGMFSLRISVATLADHIVTFEITLDAPSQDPWLLNPQDRGMVRS